MKKYLALCEKRENFRAQLLERIVKAKKEGISNETERETGIKGKESEDSIAETDIDILRYYYYLTHGVDNVYVGSMDPRLLEDILRMIPAAWRGKFKESVTELVKEVKEEYALDVKKSVIEFVIGDSLHSSLRQVRCSFFSQIRHLRYIIFI